MSGTGVFPGVSYAPNARGGAKRNPIWGLLSIYAYTLCRRTTKFDAVTHMGRGLVFRREPRLYPKGRVPSASQFWGPLYLYVQPCSQNYQIWRGNTCGEGRVYWDQCIGFPSQESGVPALPNFWGSPVFVPTPFYAERPDQVRHGNTRGERRVLGSQSRHCICTNASRGLSALAEFLVLENGR